MMRAVPPRSSTKRADLLFPMGMMHCYLRKGNYAKQIGSEAPVFLASVMQYIIAWVLTLAGWWARDYKKMRITPHHLHFY